MFNGWFAHNLKTSKTYKYMRKFITLLVAIASLNTMAQTDAPAKKGSHMNRKYQVLVELENPSAILEHNLDMKIATDRAKASAIIANAENSGEKSAFLTALSKGFGTAFVQKTQNASSNLLSVGANYIIEAMKGDSKKWYNAAKSHCTLSRKLKSESTIKDFYSAPSSLGAMDPQNIQFKGFGCHHYLEEVGNANHGEEVFYVFCSMLRDSAGISSIVNHSKFMVEVDSLMFNPKYCGLPNDSLETITPFDFSKRKNLTLTIKARIYSSWINEAIMVTNDQQLGEFTITARIDPTVLNGDSVFVYRKNDPRFQKLVNVTGDCFIVPRSFTGTNDGTSYSSTWGTGQYRIEMDVNESCKIVDEYYYKDKYKNEEIAIRQSGNGPQIAFAGIPDFKKFDKAKWQAEWTPIKARQRKASFLNTAWNSIVTAYKGTGWVQTFTDPLTNVILSYEGKELNDWLGLTATTGASGAGASAAKSSQAGGAAPSGGKPQGKK